MHVVLVTEQKNINVDVYILDSDITFLKRICAVMYTLRKYIYFPNGLPKLVDIYESDIVVTINVVDILQLIKKNSRDSSFNSFMDLEKVRGIIMHNDDMYVENVLIPSWLAFQSDLLSISGEKKYSEYEKMATVLHYKLQLVPRYLSEIEFENMVKNIDGKSVTIERDIERDVENRNDMDNISSKLEKSKSVYYTSFEEEDVQYSKNIDLSDVTLLELFNDIKLNTYVPFASVKNYFKILRDSRPSELWDEIDDDILVKIVDKDILVNVKYSDYTTVKIKYEKDKLLAIFEKNIKTTVDLEDRFTSIFNPRLKMDNRIDIQIGGVFYFPMFRVEKYILLDLIMNNKIFSQLISVNETDKTTKKRTNMTIYFNVASIGNLTATITPKQMSRNDPTMKLYQENKEFEEGSDYLRVKISKAKYVTNIMKFIGIFSKLLGMYKEEEKRIIEEYRKYIPDFLVKKEKPEYVYDGDIILQKELPGLFIPNYSRGGCDAQRMPSIIRNDDVAAAIADGKKVMGFPFDKDSSDFRYYICNHKKNPYPGIKENKLSNNIKSEGGYQVIPCCFGTDQSKPDGRGHMLYKTYFEGKDFEKLKIDQKQEYLVTNKILNRHSFGELPDNLKNFFSLDTIHTSDYRYVRKGISRLKNSKSSFLLAVLEAIQGQLNKGDPPDIFNIKDDDKLSEYVNIIRGELADDKENASLCKQEMYDRTCDEILSDIRNPNVDLDPKLFIRLLENHYNLNIYVFTDEKGLILPRHTQAYYKYIHDRKSIFIYQHMGTEIDKATYPQCELIIKLKNGDRIENKNVLNFKKTKLFANSPNKFISKLVASSFKKLSKSYVLNTLIEDIKNPFVDIDDDIIQNQRIDIYGKLRRVDIIFEEKMVSIFTDPLPPIKTKELDINSTINKTDIKNAIGIFRHIFKLKISYQIVQDGVTKEICAITDNNTKISIPIYETKTRVPDIEVRYNGLSYSENDETSIISLYSLNKKTARYLTEYIYWLYSNYFKENEEKYAGKMTDQSIIDFKDQCIEIDSNFKYDYTNIKKTFSKNSGFFSYTEKLILHSEEILKRLLYSLSIARIRNILNDYENQTVIKQYYLDITDFTQTPSQVILEGDDSVKKWLEEKDTQYNLHTNIEFSTVIPYFILFQNILYLAQNTDNLGKCTDIVQKWYSDNKYNVGLYAQSVLPIQLTLYKVTLSNDEFIVVKTPGKITTYSETKIISYPIGDKVKYVVLLPLQK
jgi:hypothetical protein